LKNPILKSYNIWHQELMASISSLYYLSHHQTNLLLFTSKDLKRVASD
jgi:hypothetical protein